MAAAAALAEKRSLPGWSLARDSPRPKAKQGWQCPAPTVEDWEDYKKWKEEQGKKEELPTAPQVFIADTSLLSYQDPDVKLPWIHRLKCELPRRVGRLSGDLPVKASFVGFGAKDGGDESYDAFKRSMAEIGVVLCRQIRHPPNRFELAHLEQSDLIFIAGGDRKRLWETLGTDLGSQVAEHIKWRYLQGAVVVAAGEAMSLLGTKSWYVHQEHNTVIPFTGWKIFPHVVASEAESIDLEDLVEQLGGAGVVILGIHKGGGMIFNRDGLIEPVRNMVQEYRWDWESSSVKQALLLGPPRGTGLLCPLYAAMKDQLEGAGEGDADAFSYALTQEEEGEEGHLMEMFDVHNLWLGTQERCEVERLKLQGNEAFKAGKADAASISYEQARTAAKSSAKRWEELSKEAQRAIDSTPDIAAGQEKPAAQRKEDHRMSSFLVPLLLNICACRLLAHEQDVQRKAGASIVDLAVQQQAADVSPSKGGETSTMLVEVRDNLVDAFRAANEALRLSGGQAAKAWYRRACVFEKMRDFRNAVRDLEESLKRAPGDAAIKKKRDEMFEPARTVAENMYYARHKELDAQEQRLGLAARRALCLCGALDDSYEDNGGEFAIAQPIARLAEGTLEEIDGRPQLKFDEEEEGRSKVAEGAPYLHAHALWTWEFLVQRAPNLRLLEIRDVDLGSGPLEWLCKGLRAHKEVKTLRLVGVHLGAAGAKMIRNVLAQNASLAEVSLDSCAMHDAGLDEVSQGLAESTGPLESLSLRGNFISHRRLGKLTQALCDPSGAPHLSELDLSENPIGALGVKELAKVVGAGEHQLRVMRLQECCIDLAGFWRLVGNLNDERPLSQLDLRRNPIGRGTRRCWRSQMGPTLRCEVLLSDHPLKARREAEASREEADARSFPLPRYWV